MSSPSNTSSQRHVLIVGAGCFGASTALHFLRDPEHRYSVTIVDRASVVPAPDAASTDINKIVRSSYADAWYTRLATEAIELWKTDEVFRGAYHESGVLTVGADVAGSVYTDAAFQNDQALGARVHAVATQEAPKYFPGLPAVGLGVTSGYINLDNGWAHATAGVAQCLAEVQRLGGKIRTSAAVQSLEYGDGGKVTGVKLVNGEVLNADVVVVAAGSWSPSAFNDEFGVTVQATGQCITTVQLSPELAEKYSKYPVVLNFGSGFYIFPPTADGIVKMAFHHVGYVNPQPVTTDSSPSPTPVSTPRTVLSNPTDGLAIPREMRTALRDGLRGVYPELAELPFVGTRLCWYCDTPNSDWLIDFHPDHPGLVLATGGSGHGYKFLPNIGTLVKQRIEGTLDAATAKRLAYQRAVGFTKDPSRLLEAQPLLLREENLVTHLV